MGGKLSGKTNAIDWLEEQGKLDALSYVHAGGITPEEDA